MDSFPLQILFPDLGLMCAEFIHSFWGNNREWNMNLFQTRNRYGQLFVGGGGGMWGAIWSGNSMEFTSSALSEGLQKGKQLCHATIY